MNELILVRNLFACKDCHYKTADLANLKKHVFLSHKDTDVNVRAKTENLETSFEKLSEFSIEIKDNSFKEQSKSLDLKINKEDRAVENQVSLHDGKEIVHIGNDHVHGKKDSVHGGKVYVHEQMSDSEHSIHKEINLFSCYLCDARFDNEESIRRHIENCVIRDRKEPILDSKSYVHEKKRIFMK